MIHLLGIFLVGGLWLGIGLLHGEPNPEPQPESEPVEEECQQYRKHSIHCTRQSRQ